MSLFYYIGHALDLILYYVWDVMHAEWIFYFLIIPLSISAILFVIKLIKGIIWGA